MKLTINNCIDVKRDVIVLGAFENKGMTWPNADLKKELAQVKKNKRFTAKLGSIYHTKHQDRDLLVVGLGKSEEITIERVRKAVSTAVNFTKKRKLKSFSTDILFQVIEHLAFTDEKQADELLGRAAAEACILADYRFTKYLNKEAKNKLSEIKLVSFKWKRKSSAFGEGLKTGRGIAEATNFSRDLVNEPANVVNSHHLEKVARNLAKDRRVGLKVLDQQELKKIGCNALLGVNQGSKNPAKMLFLHYKGSKGPLTAVLGKGITFDAGGYNLKPTKYIEDMKTDMGGGAAVLGLIKSAIALGLKKNILGVVPIAENMVSSSAQRPGDIVKAFNGKTIEIGNTDAEGRLILADALSYTQKNYRPEVMIDLATLTGACVVALGYHATGLISKDPELTQKLQQAGMQSHDQVWPLPFFDEYQDMMDGNISDLCNVSNYGKGYEGGTITAGVFLSKFVDTDKTKWVHLDIAGSAYWVKGNHYTPKGATGAGVRLLSYYLLEE